LLVTCPVTSVKLQIANYFLLTANPINEISSTITGLAVSQNEFAICNLTLVTGQVTSNLLYLCIYCYQNGSGNDRPNYIII